MKFTKPIGINQLRDQLTELRGVLCDHQLNRQLQHKLYDQSYSKLVNELYRRLYNQLHAQLTNEFRQTTQN